MHGVERGETGIFRVDEDQLVFRIDGKLMRIDVTGRMGHARDVEPLIMQRLLRGELPRTEHVLQAPDLGDGREIEPLRRGREPHGAHEIPLEHR